MDSTEPRSIAAPEQGGMSQSNAASVQEKLRRMVKRATSKVDRRNGPVSKISKHKDRDEIDYSIVAGMTYNALMGKWPWLTPDNIARRKKILIPALAVANETAKLDRASAVQNKLQEIYDLTMGTANAAAVDSNYSGVGELVDRATESVRLQMKVEGIGVEENAPIGKESTAQVAAVFQNIIAIPKLPGVDEQGKPFIEVENEEYEIAAPIKD